MTAYNGTTISYYAIGNPTNDGTWSYTWEKGRQLKQMSKSGTTAAFLYNTDGLRIRKTVGSTVTNYTLHGKNIVHMTQGSNNLHFFYDAQNRPAVVNFNGTKYGYVVNLQGDVLGLIDSTGAEVVKYTYDAWGKVLSTTGSLASTLGTVQPFRYRGYVYDVETGLYYLRSRYYNPIWNRFINADSLNSVCNNLFIYCCNVPVNCCDTNGFDAIWITDTNSFSHSSLLIQDSDGVWYYYYWGAAGSGSSGSVSMLSNSLSGRRGNVNVIYEQIDLDIGDGSEERILSSLNDLLSANNHNNIYHYPGDYDRATYLYGDFTVAHSQAEYNKNNSSKLIYDLFSMNCAQSVADLLIKAYEATNRTLDIYYLRIKKMWNAYIPNHMHNILDGIEPGEDETENRNM